ncbi:hypothetical protein L204_106387 [Cryptococcus depauperatus]
MTKDKRALATWQSSLPDTMPSKTVHNTGSQLDSQARSARLCRDGLFQPRNAIHLTCNAHRLIRHSHTLARLYRELKWKVGHFLSLQAYLLPTTGWWKTEVLNNYNLVTAVFMARFFLPSVERLYRAEMDLEKSMVCLRTKSRVLSGLLLASLAAIILMLLFIFTVSFGAAHSLTLKDPWSKWGGISPDPVVLQSRHLGGVPGYQIIENVWVNNGSIYLFAPDRYELPSKSRTVSGDTGWEVFTHPSKEMMEFARGARVLEGTTLFVNDGAKSDEWHYLSSYYHMIGEVFLGSIAAIASIPYKSSILTETTRSGVKVPSIPDRMVIPWEAATDWRDEEGLGELVLKGIFGENLLEPMHWKELSADGGRNHGWVFLQRAVIIDRWASHRHNALSDSLNKMAATVLSLPRPPFFFIPSRISLLSHLHIPIPPTRPGPVKIWNKVPKIVGSCIGRA